MIFVPFYSNIEVRIGVKIGRGLEIVLNQLPTLVHMYKRGLSTVLKRGVGPEAIAGTAFL